MGLSYLPMRWFNSWVCYEYFRVCVLNVDISIYDFPLRLGTVIICWTLRTSGHVEFAEAPSLKPMALDCRSWQCTSTRFLPTNSNGSHP